MPSSDSPPRVRLGRLTAGILAGGLLLVAAGWAVTLERIAFEREDAVAEAYRETANLALAFEQDALRALDGLGQAMAVALREHERRGPLDLGRLLSGSRFDGTLFTSLSIVDEQGVVVSSTALEPGRVLARHDELLHFHAAIPSTALRVGPPVVEPDGRPAIPVSRRIDRPDGGFGGIVLGGISPSSLMDFYEQLDIGRDGMMQLVGLQDGVVRARRTGRTKIWGGDLSRSTLLEVARSKPMGSFRSVGRLDGVERFVSYRTLPGHPLVVAVGVSVEEALRAARARKRTYLAVAAAGTVVVLLFGAVLGLGLRRHARALEDKDRADARLRESEARFRDLADNTSDFIWELDAEMRFTYASASLERLVGLEPQAMLGRRPIDFMNEEDARRIGRLMRSLVPEKKGFSGIEHGVLDAAGGHRIWEVSGVPIVDPDGTLRGYRGVSRDITERKRAEAQLEREAHYDRVTGLPNRALCFDRLKQVIATTLRHRRYAAVLLVDLDRFKSINDTLGHGVGDVVLRASAERLTACLRAGDTVARIGGDEFVILLQDLQQAQDAALVAKKVLGALGEPIVEGGQEVFATASIGIAICPPDGQRAETLLANADAALSRAKKAGRATFQFYTAEMNARAADQLALERDLRRALERREFALHYQPKAHIVGGRVAGFEALLRWTRAGTPVSPGLFIPVLEESGFIREVGAWVIDEACRQIAAWRAAGLAPVPVAINVSAKQLDAELRPIVDRALREHGVDARLVRIEITESDAMVDPERALAVLRGLKDLGIALSIDDFGTGYSSLSYLKRFQPSELKLDRSFVSGLPDNVDDVSITKAVISMAHSLGMKVVAEGVETEAQRAFLQSRGCDQMQGFLFARPLAAEDAGAFLRAERSTRVV